MKVSPVVTSLRWATVAGLAPPRGMHGAATAPFDQLGHELGFRDVVASIGEDASLTWPWQSGQNHRFWARFSPPPLGEGSWARPETPTPRDAWWRGIPLRLARKLPEPRDALKLPGSRHAYSWGIVGPLSLAVIGVQTLDLEGGVRLDDVVERLGAASSIALQDHRQAIRLATATVAPGVGTFVGTDQFQLLGATFDLGSLALDAAEEIVVLQHALHRLAAGRARALPEPGEDPSFVLPRGAHRNSLYLESDRVAFGAVGTGARPRRRVKCHYNNLTMAVSTIGLFAAGVRAAVEDATRRRRVDPLVEDALLPALRGLSNLVGNDGRYRTQVAEHLASRWRLPRLLEAVAPHVPAWRPHLP